MDLEARIREHFLSVYGLTDQATDRLVRTCRASLAKGLASLEDALSSGDVEMIIHWAHTLKGNLLSAGLTDLADAARGIESGAPSGRPGEALPDFRLLRDSLGSFLNGDAPSSGKTTAN